MAVNNNEPWALMIPERLAEKCRQTPEGSEWLARLPASIRHFQQRWSLAVTAPFDTREVSCAWVAPVTLVDGTPAVLKLGMPHFEAEHEIAGLRFWDGGPTARLIDADEHLGAMLVERCEPGTHLRVLRQQPEQDVIIAGLLRRLWGSPLAPHPFRPLAALTAYWTEEALRDQAGWADAGLTRAGLSLYDELPRTAAEHVLLATDLHAGNVLRAQRERWLAIDPKPFVGDPAFDGTQHLLNGIARLRSEPMETVSRFAELLGVDRERLRLWTFARLAVESSDSRQDGLAEIARVLAP